VRCDQVIESGAYVLGILDPGDRAAYERHLATCEICQHEVADFSGLPDLLARVDPAEAAEIGDEFAFDAPARREAELPPPVQLRPLPSVPRANPAEEFAPRNSRVQRGAARRQRRWRAVTAGLAAAACLAVGILVGTRLVDTTPGPAPTSQQLTAMHPVSSTVPITAQVALNPFIGGTEVRMHCVYDGGKPAPRWTLKLFVYPKDGSPPEQVSTWTAAHGDDLTLSAATRLQPKEIAKVELRKGDETPLLVYENA
jgi:Putative zinc-finger